MIGCAPLKRIAGTRKAHDRPVRTVCRECTLGCGLVVYVKEDRIVDVQGDEAHPVNRGRLCTRGMAFVQGLTHPERIMLPAARDRIDRPFLTLDNVDQGLDLLAERLQQNRQTHGPESLVIDCAPEAGLDFFLGALRFARLWETPHVFHPLAAPQEIRFPAGVEMSLTPSREPPENGCLFLMEADLATTHPVAFEWVLDAQRRGTKVCAVDTRFTATLAKADMAAVIQPGCGNQLGMAILKEFDAEGLWAAASAMNPMPESKAWAAVCRQLSVASIENIAGIRPGAVRSMVRLLATRSPVKMITGKRPAFFPHYGIWPAIARGTGVGWHPMETGWPALGAAIGSVFGAKHDAPAESATDFGRRAADPVSAAVRAAPKALVCSDDSLNKFLPAFPSLTADMDVAAYFGAFPNKTWERSHLVFPAAAWAETEGLWFSHDSALQWGRRVLQAPHGCCSGLGFWARLAGRFGWGDKFPWSNANGLADHQAFYAWVLSRYPETTGIDAARLKEVSVPIFPSPEQRKSAGWESPASSAPSKIGSETVSDPARRFPLAFQSTRTICGHGDAGRWWSWLRELEAEDVVQVHPDIAAALGIENGDDVRVAGAEDGCRAKAWISRMVNRQTVWSPRRLRADRVLIHKRGQSPEEAHRILKAML